MPSTMEVPIPGICHSDGGIVMWTALCELSYNCVKLRNRYDSDRLNTVVYQLLLSSH